MTDGTAAKYSAASYQHSTIQPHLLSLSSFFSPSDGGLLSVSLPVRGRVHLSITSVRFIPFLSVLYVRFAPTKTNRASPDEYIYKENFTQ